MTPKQIQAMNASPDYRSFVDSGDSQKCARLISMAYLLHSIANCYHEEANDIMQKHGLVHKKIKTRATNLMTSFDLYDKEVFQLLDKKEAQSHFCDDYDYFKSVCDKFAHLNQEK